MSSVGHWRGITSRGLFRPAWQFGFSLVGEAFWTRSPDGAGSETRSSSQMFTLPRMWNIDWPVSRVWGRLLFNRKVAVGLFGWVGGWPMHGETKLVWKHRPRRHAANESRYFLSLSLSLSFTPCLGVAFVVGFPFDSLGNRANYDPAVIEIAWRRWGNKYGCELVNSFRLTLRCPLCSFFPNSYNTSMLKGCLEFE